MSSHPFLAADNTLSVMQEKRVNIGRILLDMGRLTPEQAEQVLIAQKDLGMRFGEAAEYLGFITQDDIQKVLAHQFDYPYLQKRDIALPEELIAAYRPNTPQVETLRAIRSQLMLRWFTRERRSLVVVSVDPDAGVSVFCANLAIVFSQLGEQTLLVDSNMREPRLQKMFSLATNMGLSDILTGRAGHDEIVKIDSFVDLSVLGAGTTPPNPQELLSRESFTLFNAQLEQNYDIIFYDTSSFNTAADALIVASRVGGVLVVVQEGKSRVNDLNLLCEQFVRNGVEVVGVVMAKF